MTHGESGKSRRNRNVLSPRLADLAGVVAWSGGVIERLGPVVARSADRFTQRANSAAVVDHSYIDECGPDELDALALEIESWYRARGEEVRWQVSGLDTAIATALRRAGYTAGEPTSVYIRPPTPPSFDSANRARVADTLSHSWFDTWNEVSGRDVDSSISRAFMAKIRNGQWVSTAIVPDEVSASVGLGIEVKSLSGSHLSAGFDFDGPDTRVVCCMATRVKARRRGLAALVLDTLLDTDLVCVLQVLEDNPARHLYEARGFVRSHQYQYYTPASV